MTDQEATNRQSYQTRGGNLTVEQPKRDNEEVFQLRVNPHLKHRKKKHIVTGV